MGRLYLVHRRYCTFSGVLICLAFALSVPFWLQVVLIDRAAEADKLASNVLCKDIIFHISKAGISLVAFDFDQTIIDIHTWGLWKNTSSALIPHVRPDMRCFIAGCLERGIAVTVATFSTQTKLISRVLQQSISHEKIGVVAVFGGNDIVKGFEKGKQSQLIKSISFTNEQRVKLHQTAPLTTPSSTLLVDDDPENIQIAHIDGYNTLHYQPGQLLSLSSLSTLK